MSRSMIRVAGFCTATVCALIAAGCGGDPVVDRCIERFNSPDNQMRNFVSEGAGPREEGFRPPVWLGESKVRPEKCVAVVALDESNSFIVMRENFNPGAKPGTWNGIAGIGEGSHEELAARVREPVALGNPDGTIEAK
jgi:hypothetical protein